MGQVSLFRMTPWEAGDRICDPSGECLKRNAQSHYGTEWLHELILEAKIALAYDPTWLQTHTVLRIDFGQVTDGTANTLMLGEMSWFSDRLGTR